MAEVRCLPINSSGKSRLVRGLAECGRLKMAISMGRMRRGLAFSDFIANGECKDQGEKKRPLSGPPFFKEAKWRESEETSLTPLWGTETDRVRCREHQE